MEGGVYVTGMFRLPGNTTLFIAPDSEIRASRNLEDYTLHDVTDLWDHGRESGSGCLLLCDGVQDVCITGGGRICGMGEWFVYEPREKPLRTPHACTMIPSAVQKEEINTLPGSVRTLYRERIRYAQDRYGQGLPDMKRPACMVWILKSCRVHIHHIVLASSMRWTLNLEMCEDVTVENVVIDDNRHVANTDGVDVCGSSRVKIRHCLISCADDGVVVKNPAHTERSMEDVEVSDCRVHTVMNAFKIGTETAGDIRGIHVHDCVFELSDIYPGSVSGISIESCDGSHVQHVLVERIRMEHVLCPVYLCLNRRNRWQAPYTEETEHGRYWGGDIRDVTIRHLICHGVELPCILTGYTDVTRGGKKVRKAPSKIELEDWDMVYRDNAEQVQVPPVIPENLTDYPESNAHGDVGACGIYARHLDDLKVSDIRVTPRSTNTRPVMLLEDVTQRG